MAKKKPKPKPKLPTPPKQKPRPVTANPSDYLRGSKVVGEKYTAWNTYGGSKPDFGKDKGPGEPYHEVTKTVKKEVPNVPPKGITPTPGRVLPKLPIRRANVDRNKKDARSMAIANRLRAL